MRKPFSSTTKLFSCLFALGLGSGALGCSDKPETGVPTEALGPLGSQSNLPVDERIEVKNLSAPVDVVRDKDGRPHIYASTLADALRVEGYVVAKDRHLQVEFYRRVSEGRLSEILADADKSVIDTDITFRHLGLHRVAKQQYAALSAETKALVDAYADGITQYYQALRRGDVSLPSALFLIPVDAFTDFTGEDALAIGRLQTYLLSHSGDGELTDSLTIDKLRSTFPSNAPDPLIASRAGIVAEMYRFAPWEKAFTASGYPMGKPSPKASGKSVSLSGYAARTERYLEALRRIKSRFAPEGFGSNNWAVSAQKSASGHALLANDPHLSLVAPSIFWPVAIEVASSNPSESTKISGVAFPGIPGIILGHNEHVAWGATVAGYDVVDLYQETLTPDAKSVVFKGQNVPLQMVDEVIGIQAGSPYTYQVPVVPHHGAILPEILPDHTVAPLDAQKGAISTRWTGDEPTNEVAAIFSLLRAKSVDEAKAALNDFQVGAQNWMIADTSGDILWTSHAQVPTRDKAAFTWDPATYTGNLPCVVLPGDGTAEWTGMLADGLVPWAKNPAEGFLATANNDPIGETADNDPANGTLPDGTPMFLGCAWDIGFREARIQERLKGLDKAKPEDLSSIQADAKSALGKTLTTTLLEGIDAAEAEKKTPGTHPDLTALVADPGYDSALIGKVRQLLVDWETQADYEAASGVDPDTDEPLPESGATAVEARAAQATLIFNTFFVRLLERTFGDELQYAGRPYVPRDQRAKAILAITTLDPTKLPTYDAATGQSALWDDMATPAIVETKQERVVRALLDALASLQKELGADISAYRWGFQHRLKFEAIIPVLDQLSIPAKNDQTFPTGFPRHGDNFSVDSCDFGFSTNLAAIPRYDYDFGPNQRFVIEMDPAGPKAWNALPGGAVWDSQSPYFRDQAELWRKNETHAVPFLRNDVIAAAAGRIVMKP